MVFEEDIVQRYGLLVFILSFILLASPALEVVGIKHQSNVYVLIRKCPHTKKQKQKRYTGNIYIFF